jgi:hypothetical protein
MEVLAHRGWWSVPTERNSRAAIERAFRSGFGIETDLRLDRGDLVLSHDHPAGGEMRAEELADLVTGCPGPPMLALNIKEDGLQAYVTDLVARLAPVRWFCFDMSVPDTVACLDAGLPCWARHSDVEPQPVLYEQADGVWLDGFDGEWWTEDTIAKHLAMGKKVCVVSPELHGRPHADAWRRWLGWDVFGSDDLLLCTDHPAQAKEVFR